jgi:hypothetical protein
LIPPATRVASTSPAASIDSNAEKAQQGRDVRERGENHQTLLELAQLDQPLVFDGLHDPLGAFLVPFQPRVQDVRGRSVGVPGGLERLVDAMLGKKFVDFTEDLLGPGALRHQIEELPDDHHDADQHARCEWPDHEAGLSPKKHDRLANCPVWYFKTWNLDQSAVDSHETHQKDLQPQCRILVFPIATMGSII